MAAKDLSQHPVLQRHGKLVEQAEFTVSKERQARMPNVTFWGGYAREIGREAVLGGLSVPTPVWYRQPGHIATALGTQRKEEAEFIRARNSLAREGDQTDRRAGAANEQNP